MVGKPELSFEVFIRSEFSSTLKWFHFILTFVSDWINQKSVYVVKEIYLNAQWIKKSEQNVLVRECYGAFCDLQQGWKVSTQGLNILQPQSDFMLKV